MAIELNPITNPEKVGGFNTNFQLIEDELNNNVLRRKGVDVGEANQLEIDLDLNGHDIVNAGTVGAQDITVSGVSIKTQVDSAASSASAASTSASEALSSENAAEAALGKINPTFASVADMVAFTDLDVGERVRTLGYYTPGDGGGNDYEIVDAATGTDDGGSFLDLSGSGFQAKGLFPANIARGEQFGCIGDGSDNKTPLQAFFDFVNQGIKGEITTPGNYGLSSGLGISVNNTIDVRFASGVKFIALAGFPTNDKLVQIGAGTAVDAVFSWVGGELDGVNIPNSGAGEANDLFYFTAPDNCTSVTIHLDRTYAGDDWLNSGSDSHVFAVANNLDINIKDAVGAWDAAVYISGDSTDSTQGFRAKVRGNYTKCKNAVIFKRDYQEIDVNIFVEDCLNGAGYADDASVGGVESRGGDGGRICVNSRRTQRSAFIQGGSDTIVEVNAIDIGVSIPGFTSTAAQAINLEGASNNLVRLNVSGVNPALTRDAQFIGVKLGDRLVEAATLLSRDNLIVINSVGAGTSLSETGGSDRNTFVVKEENSFSAPSYVGAESSIQWTRNGQIIQAFGGALSNQYTSSAKEVTETGATNLNKEYVTSATIQWLMRDGASIPARCSYVHSTGQWEWRAGGSGVVMSIDKNGPKMPTYTVAGLPGTGLEIAAMAFATDGRKNGEGAGAGTGVLVFYDGTNWIAVDSGQPVLA